MSCSRRIQTVFNRSFDGLRELHSADWGSLSASQVVTGCKVCKVPRSFGYSAIFVGSLKKCLSSYVSLVV